LEDGNITKSPILDIVGVHKRFGSYCAVRDVTIQVQAGEFLTLLGPSGCGKTTLLRMVAGFETPSEGWIDISGRRMNDVPPYERPIGIVFQNLALFPHLSVGENLAYGLRIRRKAREEIDKNVAEALALVDLAGLEQRRIHELSGGQRQRVALARSLIIRPEVLLLDEPLGALDLKLRQQLQQELKRIQQRVGTTFVFVTHDQEEALTMSDRIAVMQGGCVEQLGTPEEIYTQPRTPFVAQFVGETNFLTGRVARNEPGRIHVRLDRGARTVAVPSSERLAEGSRVGVSVRPEHIVPAESGEALALTLDGVVVERCYVGANTRYTFEADGEIYLAVVAASDAGGGSLQPGQRTRFGWAAGGAAVLPLDATDALPADREEKA
jgi:spermidine/putrescine ABC transporter ATP-binding subunit